MFKENGLALGFSLEDRLDFGFEDASIAAAAPSLFVAAVAVAGPLPFAESASDAETAASTGVVGT
jgi:hypothetical protein